VTGWEEGGYLRVILDIIDGMWILGGCVGTMRILWEGVLSENGLRGGW
jgi:hypothetical protein